MPQTPCVAEHFAASEVVRGIVTGVSDGLVGPFGFAAFGKESTVTFSTFRRVGRAVRHLQVHQT